MAYVHHVQVLTHTQISCACAHRKEEDHDELFPPVGLPQGKSWSGWRLAVGFPHNVPHAQIQLVQNHLNAK